MADHQGTPSWRLVFVRIEVSGTRDFTQEELVISVDKQLAVAFSESHLGGKDHLGVIARCFLGTSVGRSDLART